MLIYAVKWYINKFIYFWRNLDIFRGPFFSRHSVYIAIESVCVVCRSERALIVACDEWSACSLIKSVRQWSVISKCIGDDTKAAARQSLNCNKKKQKKYGEERCSIRRFMESKSCGMWLWNRDSEFTKWQHPAMWYVALRWHATEFVETSAILEFYIWFRYRPHHHSRHVILHKSPKFIQIGPPSAEITNIMSIFKMADLIHLGF